MSGKTLFSEGGNPSNDPGNPNPVTDPGKPDPSGGGGTSELPEWLSGLSDVSDEIKSDPSLKVFQNVDGLVKSYVNAQKLIGKDKVTIPTKEDGEEVWNGFYRKLGVPEKTEDYKIDRPQDVKEDDEYFAAFVAEAHKNGLMPKQAKAMAEFQIRFASDQQKEMDNRAQQALLDQIEEFKKEEGDKFNDTVYKAKLAVKQFDDQDESFSKLVDEDPTFGNNPKLIRFLARIAGHLSEDTFRATSTSNIGTTAEEAQQKMNEIMGNPESPYWIQAHPDHKRVVAEMQKLTNVVMRG